MDAAGVSHRKVHAEDIPRLGGIAIVTGFYVPLVSLMVYETWVGNTVVQNQQLVTGLLGGGLMIALLGLYDDLKNASPKLKLLVQVGVAVAVTLLGFQIDKVDLPFISQIHLGWATIPITVLWIVGEILHLQSIVGEIVKLGAFFTAITPLVVAPAIGSY